ncbi:MAG: tetratricopeptide repeat protein [Gallionella sp.]
MIQIKYIICASLLLSACVQAPKQTVNVDSVVLDQEPATHAMKLPNVELTSELLFDFLVAEIAAQRGEVDLAVAGSSNLAQKTRDPRLAMRAAHMAIRSGRVDKAIDLIKIWQEADPDSPMATRMLASAFLRMGRMDEARDELLKLLNTDKRSIRQNLMQTYQMLAPYHDKSAALIAMQEIAAVYPDEAESHWAVAQIARVAGDEELALSEIRMARDMRPEWDQAASFEAQVLHKGASQQGLEILQVYLGQYPDAKEIRLQYARMLLDQKQFELSRDQFQILADENPNNPEMAYAIALISLQLNDLPRSQAQFMQSLEKGKKDRDIVQYYLGKLGEIKKDDQEALEHYRQVQGGENHFLAQVRIVYLLSKAGHHDEARLSLDAIQPVGEEQQIKLVLVEANILRLKNRYVEAYQLLKENLELNPKHPEILYETAMMAEKNDEFDSFERLMRKLLDIDPEHAHAYNALGYGLLERKERLSEAMELIQKAIKISPDDAAIIDSLGWGYFLTGKHDESLKQLRRAYSLDSDPEIAAHLGEVLWVKGEKDEAKKVWQDSIRGNPENAVLRTVVKRYMP